MGTGFVEAMKETLLNGGDTDTNACIIGGLIGAAVGANKIPEKWKNFVITSSTIQGKYRPDIYHPSLISRFAAGLVQSAPSNLN